MTMETVSPLSRFLDICFCYGHKLFVTYVFIGHDTGCLVGDYGLEHVSYVTAVGELLVLVLYVGLYLFTDHLGGFIA